MSDANGCFSYSKVKLLMSFVCLMFEVCVKHNKTSAAAQRLASCEETWTWAEDLQLKLHVLRRFLLFLLFPSEAADQICSWFFMKGKSVWAFHPLPVYFSLWRSFSPSCPHFLWRTNEPTQEIKEQIRSMWTHTNTHLHTHTGWFPSACVCESHTPQWWQRQTHTQVGRCCPGNSRCDGGAGQRSNTLSFTAEGRLLTRCLNVKPHLMPTSFKSLQESEIWRRANFSRKNHQVCCDRIICRSFSWFTRVGL